MGTRRVAAFARRSDSRSCSIDDPTPTISRSCSYGQVLGDMAESMCLLQLCSCLPASGCADAAGHAQSAARAGGRARRRSRASARRCSGRCSVCVPSRCQSASLMRSRISAVELARGLERLERRRDRPIVVEAPRELVLVVAGDLRVVGGDQHPQPDRRGHLAVGEMMHDLARATICPAPAARRAPRRSRPRAPRRRRGSRPCTDRPVSCASVLIHGEPADFFCMRRACALSRASWRCPAPPLPARSPGSR